LVKAYEALDPAKLHRWLQGLISPTPGTVLDIGAGTGRDAAWLAGLGHDVVAVEPAPGMRTEAQQLHANPRIRWLDDQLPDLGTVGRLGISFDLVMLNAVWQHVAPPDRERAFRKMAKLVKSGGLLAITLRHGPVPDDRVMHDVSVDEVERLARNHGFAVEKIDHAADQGGRVGVTWTGVALRLPDDGTGALPLLRHIILNDAKAATYKLGLLRALCRAADGSAGIVRDTGGDVVAVPMGLVALNWLRLYMSLLKRGMPQTPTNVGTTGLGFAKAPFQTLLVECSASDLRIGSRFTQDRARSLHMALRDAAQTIDRMPATYITYPSGGRVLPVHRERVAIAPSAIELNAGYLASFGWMDVPAHLWRAMVRNAAWIEPTLIAEWTRLIRDYAQRQDRPVAEEAIGAGMRWSDPKRDVMRVHQIAVGALNSGELRCAWTDRPLTSATLDIDHMFPWAAWPCSDLWNLLPSHREVNQRRKRDRLPSALALYRAEARIMNWWETAYLKRTALSEQFGEEARASLPALSSSALEDVFAAVALQRIRLRHDQQVPEWDGSS
jgi:SAM-dependent methyltransferase